MVVAVAGEVTALPKVFKNRNTYTLACKREISTMVNLLSKAFLSKVMGVSLVVFIILGASSCANIENTEPVLNTSAESIEFDFEEIRNRGTLRMITRYRPTSYFLLGGMDRGFEFELVSRFARENGLKVEVILIGSYEDPFQMLESGEGDLIADHFAINEKLQDKVAFSAPYNYINQVYENDDLKIENILLMKFSSEENEEIVGSNTHQYQATARYTGGKSPGMTVTNSDSIAWATRKNAPVLKQKMDEFIGKHIKIRESDGRILRSAYLNNLWRRYFERDRFESRYHDRAYEAIYTGYLSPYDDMVRSIAEEAGVDWKLVIAVMAQESAFDPEAESLAGARGLMQIIPRFSIVVDKTDLYEPEVNIREGVRYLRKHLTREAHLDSLNQHSMALAAYNVGMGNLADARELAVKLGNDPDEWQNIADALLKLMHPEYYQHARFGYKRGTETVNYVEDVLNRYSRYQAIYEMAVLFKEKDNQEMIVLNR